MMPSDAATRGMQVELRAPSRAAEGRSIPAVLYPAAVNTGMFCLHSWHFPMLFWKKTPCRCCGTPVCCLQAPTSCDLQAVCLPCRLPMTRGQQRRGQAAPPDLRRRQGEASRAGTGASGFPDPQQLVATSSDNAIKIPCLAHARGPRIPWMIMILIGCFKTGKVGPVRVPLRTGTSRTTPGGHRARISLSLLWFGRLVSKSAGLFSC
jgi:hypothetical protein